MKVHFASQVLKKSNSTSVNDVKGKVMQQPQENVMTDFK